jgi:hypothetical protein
VGKCAAPADEADHKYVLRGWTDAGRGCRRWKPIRKPASGQSPEIGYRHLRESGAVE